MNNQERGRRIARLAHLGVPQAFHASIAERTPPRGHTLMHAAIILASIGLAVLALVAWSRYVAMIAESAAEREGAQLYNSDLGLESLGGLFTVLFAAGWLCSWLTRSRGSEGTRNGTAYDLIHEPAKNKAITDRIWRWMVARRLPAANANHFLDCLAGSLARYLMLAALGSFAITAVLWWPPGPHQPCIMCHGPSGTGGGLTWASTMFEKPIRAAQELAKIKLSFDQPWATPSKEKAFHQWRSRGTLQYAQAKPPEIAQTQLRVCSAPSRTATRGIGLLPLDTRCSAPRRKQT